TVGSDQQSCWAYAVAHELGSLYIEICRMRIWRSTNGIAVPMRAGVLMAW
ncbi:hypothetical protein H0E87_030134, partial [Populus deltoides]